MAVQYSIQKMVSDGTLSTVALGIQYLQRNDIYIRIAGEETPQSGAPSGYTWSFLDNTTLKILPVVPNGVEVVVYRRTDVDAMYNVYSQNAQFDEATIDENNQQLLYIAQEYLEQGLPGAGVDTLEYVRDDGSFTYYRLRRTDGSYSEEFTVPSASSSTKVLAREALRRSYAETGYNLVDGSFTAGGTLINANDVLLQDSTGKGFTGPAGPVAAGTDPASGGFVDVSPRLLRKDEGYVEAWRSEYPDDTDCIKAALLSGAIIVKLTNPIYNIRGAELYVPKYVTLDLGGKTLRLKDNAGASRRTLLEQDEYSTIINGVVDGNYQNNMSDFASWVNIGDVPQSHGIYTSRYQTNGYVYKDGKGCHFDKVKIINTIRSNVVLTGSNQDHGTFEAENSLTDHLIYFSASDGVGYEKAVLSGICRAECISIGTAGSGVSAVSPSRKFHGGVTVFKNIKKAPFILSGYDEEPVWIQGRDIGTEICEGEFRIIYVDDTEIASQLTSNGRRIAFSGNYTVNICLLIVNSVITQNGSAVANAYFLDVRGGANVTVGKYKANLTARDAGYASALAPLRCDTGAQCSIGTMTVVLDSKGGTNVRGMYAEEANIRIGDLNATSDTGTLFRVQAINNDATVIVNRIINASGFTASEAIFRDAARTYDGRVIIENARNVESPSLAASQVINAFNLNMLTLFSALPDPYTINSISGGLIGQRITLVGDGKAKRNPSNSSIAWQGGNELAVRPLAVGEAVELFKHTDGKWHEVPKTNIGSFVMYRTNSPIGKVVPLYLWQECFDQTAKVWYKATGTATVNDWVAIS